MYGRGVGGGGGGGGSGMHGDSKESEVIDQSDRTRAEIQEGAQIQRTKIWGSKPCCIVMHNVTCRAWLVSFSQVLCTPRMFSVSYLQTARLPIPEL